MNLAKYIFATVFLFFVVAPVQSKPITFKKPPILADLGNEVHYLLAIKEETANPLRVFTKQSFKRSGNEYFILTVIDCENKWYSYAGQGATAKTIKLDKIIPVSFDHLVRGSSAYEKAKYVCSKYRNWIEP